MKNPTIKEIEKRLDVLVQTVCRCKGAELKDGVVVTRCVTCGKYYPCFGKDCIQGGHFIPRGCRCTRWLYDNVFPQCSRCNGFLGGNYIMYSRWMQQNKPDAYEGLMNLFEKHKRGEAPRLTLLEKQALYNSWLLKGRKLEEKIGEKLFPKSWDYVKL